MDFGKKLLRRAPSRNKPMTPTAFGREIASLVRQVEVRVDAADTVAPTGKQRSDH
jgi:hypothetical protein